MNIDVYAQYFDQMLDIFQTVESYFAEIPDAFNVYINDKVTFRKKLDSAEFPVAFLGTFSSGKSTVINAIIGEAILPEATKSYTAIPTIVKKGLQDRAVIYFLGEQEKVELRNLYLEEIAKELRKTSRYYHALANSDLILKLQQDIAEYGPGGGVKSQKYVNELEKLISGWDSIKQQVKSVSLQDLPKYVTEDYKDILFVDRAEIELKEIKIPQDIVLVDLPGLGVVNPRHRKITQAYIEQKAKAFLVNTVVFKLLEGEEIDLLAEINKQRPNVLKRAFWVINKWDTANKQQKKEEQENLVEKVTQYNFDINNDRIFTVSALVYLLLELIANNKLNDSGKIKEHVETLEKTIGKIPETAEEAVHFMHSFGESKNFINLKNSLFDYLNFSAKQEFLDEVKAECYDLCNQLHKLIEPHYKGEQYGNVRNIFIASKVYKELDEYVNYVSFLISDHIEKVRVDFVPSFLFWDDEFQGQLEYFISELMQNLDIRYFKNELMKGADISVVITRLPQKIEEKLQIDKLLRKRILSIVERKIVIDILRPFMEAVLETEYLTPSLSQLLTSKMDGVEISSRFKGVCDSCLFDYGQVIDSIGSDTAKSLPSVLVEGSTTDDDIEFALKHYEDKILEYVRTKLRTSICRLSVRTIKNYFEEIEIELLKAISESKPDIAKIIMEEITTNIDGEIEFEAKRQELINAGYHKLQKIQDELNALRAGSISVG